MIFGISVGMSLGGPFLGEGSQIGSSAWQEQHRVASMTPSLQAYLHHTTGCCIALERQGSLLPFRELLSTLEGTYAKAWDRDIRVRIAKAYAMASLKPETVKHSIVLPS